MAEVLSVERRATNPFVDQKPGTSGLRKSVPTFLQPNYSENFIQAILTIAKSNLKPGEKFVFVSGGDGRYFVRECLKSIIIPMCAANGMSELIIGHDGILSTPAISTMIRKYSTSGAIILTASHNPGGPDGDFGIKYNIDNGGPATESITDALYDVTTNISEYFTIRQQMSVNLSTVGSTVYQLEDGKSFKLTIMSSVEDHFLQMKEIFDFPSIKGFLNGGGGSESFNIVADALHGVTGPYLKRILLDEFGLDESSAHNCIPLEDFGHHHPDPNLTYAADLVRHVRCNKEIGLAAAFDGDGDRNMVIGRNGFFVTPCDSLAVIADNAECIKYFKEKGIRGFARSMPTSPAIDRVCTKKNLPVFETPTGWKFFGNLMDADLCSVCGEESFGTGSNHIREKDGMWAFLAWLSILADRKKQGKSYEVESVLFDHWATYGRDFFTRYDFENCTSDEGDKMIQRLETLLKDPNFPGRVVVTRSGMKFTVLSMDNFSYTDPVDKSVSVKQGYRILLDHDTRMVFRLSGTGSSGATLRLYVNTFSSDVSVQSLPASIFMSPHIELALSFCGVEFITGRTKPTVIT